MCKYNGRQVAARTAFYLRFSMSDGFLTLALQWRRFKEFYHPLLLPIIKRALLDFYLRGNEALFTLFA